MTAEATSRFGTPITSVTELEGIVGQATYPARDKVRTALHELDREFLAASSLGFVATADPDGGLDVSPKGDPAGSFAIVLDDRTLAIPERPGNRRADGFHNLLADPRIGLIFVVPGRGDTLRVNGTARMVRDAPWFADLRVRNHVPVIGLEVEIAEVFYHCSKAFLRSRAWDPESWEPDAAPRRAVISQALERKDQTLAEVEQHYGPSYAEKIYG
ncbi:MSMEG_1061 family FMN-dependent PPOX-type flavoprotein [Myceligenerans pegani]|uniref:Pyridoxamine 5'-phosphate oxidase family protein n=1 Tax=Myceligenerans pegani TaxID=2776917 RepID=A0ABR9MZH3_9MICO|nr:MSMEG_1061 family FMN-dependent PPOX-type flavoprotein [Myceligenerans sp. TRM 65318]MBE1876248.1 pyridoxamine 5'-phosphate oxidase family protein [Myceligenerans sp. TRM 65318]MBE3018519.1 pyridoxamine 5'-phosphate oxidase family protein [Myceligenerans sp. TRM 65318]